MVCVVCCDCVSEWRRCLSDDSAVVGKMAWNWQEDRVGSSQEVRSIRLASPNATKRRWKESRAGSWMRELQRFTEWEIVIEVAAFVESYLVTSCMCKYCTRAKDTLSSDYIQQTLPVTYTYPLVSCTQVHSRYAHAFTWRCSLAFAPRPR